ncbi:hypothetical protein TrST_g8850 [Triparma strigata]|uniref:Uncharacterized protein n=1 Tax=Triparma strigata TaxID=1606541 RepID=A0A9W7ADF8_9STRA|nr:hypothetical protein TrST_g8850 [Triparma strigata]
MLSSSSRLLQISLNSLKSSRNTVRLVGLGLPRDNTKAFQLRQLYTKQTSLIRSPSSNSKLFLPTASSILNTKQLNAKSLSSRGTPPPPRGGGVGRLASLAAMGSVLFGKTKYILVGLKMTKMMPLVSMIGTSFAYSFFFGWPYSVGMVGLIFVHETGHAIALRHYGIPFSPMVMIPFMGAVIATKELPRNAYQDAMVAIAGPVAGSVGALSCAVAAGSTDSQLLYALADFGYMINLFNLMPIGSMDGGRIAGAIHPGIGAVGVLGAGGLIVAGAVHNPIFYLITAAGAYSSGRRLLGYEHEVPGYYEIPPSQKAGLGLSYVALIAALLLAMSENNKKRKTPKQLQGGYSPRNEDGVLYDDMSSNFISSLDDDDEGFF